MGKPKKPAAPAKLPKWKPQWVPWRIDGARMREARFDKGLRQFDLSYETGLGVALISHLENNTGRNASVEALGLICDCLDVSADWICGRSNKRKRSK